MLHLTYCMCCTRSIHTWFCFQAFFQLDLLCLFDSLWQQGQWHCPVIALTARLPVGWRRVMRVFHYGWDGWVRLADADRQQMCKVGGWFVKGSTASQRRWRTAWGGGKLCWGTLSLILHRCHNKVKVSSTTVSPHNMVMSAKHIKFKQQNFIEYLFIPV